MPARCDPLSTSSPHPTPDPGSPPPLSPAEHFVYHARGECGFPDGTGPGVYFLGRYFWGREEYVRFDSRRGSFEAVTELGEPDAEYWNSEEPFLEQERAEVDRFCRHNYEVYEPIAAARKLKPQLQITPMDADPSSSPHLTLLVCSVDSFFPAKINVTWLRNGQEEDEGRVVSTDLIRNGDWTFSMQVMLEAQPERGDVYACRVEHASLPEPSSVQWEPQSDSARSKMWTGVVGLLLGLAFAVPGLALYLKSKKGDGSSWGPPSLSLQLQITPTDADPSSSPHTLLVCSVDSFFPAKIKITWLRNGQEEDEGRVVSTGLIRNGDWTFSVQVMLETQPERGDVYACRVEHASLPEPTSVQWEPQSDSARSKMWAGVVGLLLGLAFAVPGLALHLRSKKGCSSAPQLGTRSLALPSCSCRFPAGWCNVSSCVFLTAVAGQHEGLQHSPAQNWAPH
ncbi:hypothetical protein lerEdw1_011449 [Lerista edwardsae]|nr:hypothetical protein lerEdw1_011449 [Lerista edwardsae]